MTTLDDRPVVKPCGCPDACDHLPYDRLSRGAVELGRRVDELAEVMRSAVRAMRSRGAVAGMGVILDYAAEVPELLEGLDDADTAGAAT